MILLSNLGELNIFFALQDIVHNPFFFKFLLVAAAKVLQLCLTLCNPIDCSPPGSPVPGILQARTLEWVAIVFTYIILLFPIST